MGSLRIGLVKILSLCHRHTILTASQLLWKPCGGVWRGWLLPWVSSGWNTIPRKFPSLSYSTLLSISCTRVIDDFYRCPRLGGIANALTNHINALKLYLAWMTLWKNRIQPGKSKNLIGFIKGFLNLAASHVATRKAHLRTVQNGRCL